MMGDGLAHHIEVAMNFVIRETDHAKAFLFHEPGAGFIVSGGGLCSVLVAVQLNDQLCLEACKIRDVGPDGLLAAEFESGKLPVAQNKP